MNDDHDCQYYSFDDEQSGIEAPGEAVNYTNVIDVFLANAEHKRFFICVFDSGEAELLVVPS